MMFLLQCPQCNHQMKYHTPKPVSVKNRKRCVYCGHSYGVRKAIIKIVEG